VASLAGEGRGIEGNCHAPKLWAVGKFEAENLMLGKI